MARGAALDGQPSITKAAVEEYCRCVTERDLAGIDRLFAPDAVLQPADGVARHGHRSIVEAFGDGFARRLDPRPGIPLVDGARAAVEVDLAVGGRTRQLLDLFEVDGAGRVTSLRIFESGPRDG